MPTTPADFRSIALNFPEASESAHMDHPDFRVRGKIFATLGYPNKQWGMVKLTLKDQYILMRAEPKVFVPAKGAWGRQGATCVLLKVVKKATCAKRSLPPGAPPPPSLLPARTSNLWDFHSFFLRACNYLLKLVYFRANIRRDSPFHSSPSRPARL